MATGRTLHHPILNLGLMEPVEIARRLQARRLKRRHLALVLAAIVAGALVSLSLVLDPPSTPPPRTIYLPPDKPG